MNEDKSNSNWCLKNYDTMETDKKLVLNLRDLGHTIRFLFEGKGSQKRILIILYETGGMTQRELTERLGIQPGSVSEVIGKLDNAGLIRREPSREDHRTVDIRLTESGEIKARDAARQREMRHQEMFSCLSAEEKDTLLALAEKLNADWDNRYGDSHNQRI
ncbi:MAG: MarR family winged helix-turn-helix transcriptional regulator [Suilimivivens sp.]